MPSPVYAKSSVGAHGGAPYKRRQETLNLPKPPASSVDKKLPLVYSYRCARANGRIIGGAFHEKAG